MSSARPLFVSRASKAAFSSLAVTVVIAVLTILALALGAVQDSRADSKLESKILGITSVEDPVSEWGTAMVGTLPERSEASQRLAVISRRALSSDSMFSRGPQGPSQEWMGMSKVAFPLLVSDLVGDRTVRAPKVMTGRTVGVTK